MDDRLALSIVHASGASTRWGGDEPDAGAVPVGLGFSTAIPGGFKDLSCTLLRPIDVDSPDLGLYDSIRAYGPGNETAFEGRQAQFPRSHGDDTTIGVGAIGWSSHLMDDKSFREVYVDTEIGGWAGLPLNRRLAILALSYVLDQDYSSKTDQGSLGFDGTTGKAIPNNSRTELMYAMPPGLALAKLMYRGTEANTTNVEAATLLTDDNDAFSSLTSTGLTLDDTFRTATPAVAERYGVLRASATATHTPAAASPFSRTFKDLAVYADHGLTTYPVDSDTDGVYASDVIADVLSRAAPLLNYTTGEGGSIEATSFAIPQLAFKDPTSAEQVILALNAYHLWEWGVYDDRLFFFRPTDPDRLTWEARLSEGAQLSLEGDEADNVYNGVIVHFKEPDGTEKIAGPTGSGFDVEDAALEDTSAENPVNSHGIPKRWGELQITPVTTEAGAVQIGRVWLAEQSLPSRRGELRVVGSMRHPTAGERSAWAVRAGDYVRIPDHPADVPRRIIETRYENDGKSLSCTLDSSLFKVEAILERLGIQQVA